MTHVAIIRVARDRLSIAWGGVTLLNDIGALKIIPHVVHLSGTCHLKPVHLIPHHSNRNYQTCPARCYCAQ